MYAVLLFSLLEIDRYLGFTDISVSAKTADISVSIGVDKTLYIPHASRQLAQESTTKQVETVILQQRYQVRFHKQTDKINRGACVGRHNRNKSIIGKFRNA